MSKFKLIEALDQLLHCHEEHPSGTTKRERYYSHPIKPNGHEGHEVAKTGMMNTWYCRDCHEWFRKYRVKYDGSLNHSWTEREMKNRHYKP